MSLEERKAFFMRTSKKIWDRREKHRKKWTWFDWLLIGLAIFFLVGGYCFFRVRVVGNNGMQGTVTYTVLLADIEDERFFNADGQMPFAIGDTVKSQNGTAELGAITEISRRVHRMATVKNGRLVWIDSNGRYDYYVTVKSRASHAVGDGIRIEDIRVAAGLRMTLRLGGFLGTGAQVVSVEWEDVKDD